MDGRERGCLATRLIPSRSSRDGYSSTRSRGLAPHVDHIVLVGAHAIYLHTEEGDRLVDKDAFDAYRLLRLPTAAMIDGLRRMLGDERTRPTAEVGIEHIRRLFASADAIGSLLAGRSVEGVGDPMTVRLATTTLGEELLRALAA